MCMMQEAYDWCGSSSSDSDNRLSPAVDAHVHSLVDIRCNRSNSTNVPARTRYARSCKLTHGVSMRVHSYRRCRTHDAIVANDHIADMTPTRVNGCMTLTQDAMLSVDVHEIDTALKPILTLLRFLGYYPRAHDVPAKGTRAHRLQLVLYYMIAVGATVLNGYFSQLMLRQFYARVALGG